MIPKFRAWDKRQNVMRDVAVLHFTKSGKVNSIEYWKTPSELKSYYVRNIELMQSTGLKDKNGVEIFEGDIVLADGVKKIVTAMNIQEGIKELESIKMKSEDMRADCFNNGLNAGITVMKNKTSPVWAINP